MSHQGNQGNPPYGQQPGGYGQPGQYGAPPGQFGQPQGGPQWQGAPGGPGEPPKSNNALILGLGGAGVLVLVILVFTAFVAPGFLVGDDEPVATSNSTPETSATDGPTDEPSASPIPTMADSTPSTGQPSPAMVTMATDFVTALNTGNRSGATAVLCAKSKQRLSDTFDRYVRYRASVKVDTTSGSQQVAIVRLSGTMRGEKAQGLVVVNDLQTPGKPCVLTFYVIGD